LAEGYSLSGTFKYGFYDVEYGYNNEVPAIIQYSYDVNWGRVADFAYKTGTDLVDLINGIINGIKSLPPMPMPLPVPIPV